MPDFGIMRGFNEKLFGDKLVAGQLPINLGLIGSQDVESLLLDFYPNAAAAYSLRKLRLLYTGSAIRVRRSSDNTEQDIGFVSNDLDTTALTSFCSGTNGFVTTWYDQSGNGNNATQTTAANQPQIVSSGSIININSKASLQFDGVNQRFNIPTISIAFNSLSIMGVVKSDSATSNGMPFANPDSERIYLGYITSSTLYFGYNDAATKFNLGAATTNQELIELYAGTNANAYRNTNASTQITSATTNITTTDLSIGSYNRSGTKSNYYDGNIQEIIMYTSNQSSNRTGIETNINTYYAIY
jgi:hypothetical protein